MASPDRCACSRVDGQGQVVKQVRCNFGGIAGTAPLVDRLARDIERLTVSQTCVADLGSVIDRIRQARADIQNGRETPTAKDLPLDRIADVASPGNIPGPAKHEVIADIVVSVALVQIGVVGIQIAKRIKVCDAVVKCRR